MVTLPTRRGVILPLVVTFILGLGAFAVVARRPACRFGITAAHGVRDYDLAGLGAGSYLDWRMQADPPRPGGVEYVQVVRLRDAVFGEQLARIASVARAQRGSHWLVGNEPDNTYEFDGAPQDNLAPEVYAERYQAAYWAIKAADPTAQVGIGGIVQPTPVRLEYLERMLAAYQARFGTPPPADLWFIHNFILNEVPGEWGAGLPADAVRRPYSAKPESIAPEAVDDLGVFRQRIEAFRRWMAEHGQRDKPLWLTEYGVLMPSQESAEGYFTIPAARTRAFLEGSFAYLQAAQDAETGLPADRNRLVQRWYWWTLSYDARVSGGALYDLSQGAPRKTELYDAYAAASDCR
jgi:hypothetical protein